VDDIPPPPLQSPLTARFLRLSRPGGRPHVVVVSQNADLELDIRPREEAIALREAGFHVTLVGGAESPARVRELIGDEIDLALFRMPSERRGALGQVVEQSAAFMRACGALHAVFRAHSVDAVHSANPPDNLWLASAWLRLLHNSHHFVFDQHDVAPVLVAEKFGAKGVMGVVVGVAKWLERMSYRRASLVVFANPEYQRRAGALGLLRSPGVVVPNGWRLPDGDISDEWRSGARYLVAYVGAINEQDCVEHLVESAAQLSVESVRFVVAGDGSALEAAKRRARELGVADAFSWLGWVRNRTSIASLVRSADVCVLPEVDSPFNRLASFVKLTEYMSLGAMVVAHRLPQTETVAGDTVAYADDMSATALARALELLLRDPELGKQLGGRAALRFDDTIAWEHVGALSLVDAYRRLLETVPHVRPLT